MTVSTLSQKQLNRSYLARQMLIKREEMPLREAVARLVGLQSQVNNPPYIGLWTRLADFHRQALTEAMERREIVRAALMRSTLHLFTAEDFLALYTALQPALARALNAFFGQRAKGLDIPALVEAARAEFSTGPKRLSSCARRCWPWRPDGMWMRSTTPSAVTCRLSKCRPAVCGDVVAARPLRWLSRI